MKHRSYDVAVVGGGIVGLAHAYQAARRGRKVAVFEREDQAVGASIRNFGMVWPIGQATATVERALRSRQHWLDLAQAAGFWAQPWGSLHLAYHPDELAVLEEFVSGVAGQPYRVRLLKPDEIPAISSAVRGQGLLGGMFSATEVNVDPRQAVQRITGYLAERMGVDFYHRHSIREIQHPYLRTATATYAADRIIVANGADFATLYPEQFDAAPLRKCKLQMMRTAPQPGAWQLGPNLAAGLTLQHYASFAQCPSLPVLKQRLAAEMPEYNRYGIHVMMSQTALGELTIGDSHEYGHTFDPFNREEINRLILDYLHTFALAPDLQIAEHWYGVYAKLTNGATELLLEPEPGVLIVNGVGGAGMTLSFGLAEEVMTGQLQISTV
ncbi:MAG: TIGR03364 family FAD-dependent oxidoreductase [Lewinella sp.]|nr:TIGR03364 family FAD-dependent oxidoreductase [Lewinella sp.]